MSNRRKLPVTPERAEEAKNLLREMNIPQDAVVDLSPWRADPEFARQWDAAVREAIDRGWGPLLASRGLPQPGAVWGEMETPPPFPNALSERPDLYVATFIAAVAAELASRS